MKKPKSKIFGFVALGLLIAGTVYLGILVTGGSKSIVDQRKKLVNLKQEASDMDTLAKQYNELKPKIAEIGKAIPASTVDIASFLQDINSSANATDVKVQIKVADNKQAEKTKEGQKVEVQLLISGNYVNTTRFIKRVSDLPYYFTVQAVDMQPVSASELATTVNLELVTSYHETN